MISKSSIGSLSGPGSNPYRSVEFLGGLLRSCLQALIARQISHIKHLDIFPKRSILVVIPTKFSLPVNF